MEINVSTGPNSSIVLNCSYVLGANEKIDGISWFKSISGDYQRLVKFSSSGAVYYKDSLKNRSQYVNYSDDSPSAILIINDVHCEDSGSYKCIITYIIDDSLGKDIQNFTNVSVKGK